MTANEGLESRLKKGGLPQQCKQTDDNPTNDNSHEQDVTTTTTTATLRDQIVQLESAKMKLDEENAALKKANDALT